MLLPAVPVVHHHLGIPLREVEAAALPSLAPRNRGGPRVPAHLDRHRVPRRQRPGQDEAHDGAVGREGIDAAHRLALDPDVAHVIEGEVRILEIVEPAASFDRIGVGPAGAGPKGIEIEWREKWSACRASGCGSGSARSRPARRAARPVGPRSRRPTCCCQYVIRRGRLPLAGAARAPRRSRRPRVQESDARVQASAGNIGADRRIWHRGAPPDAVPRRNR